MFPVTRVTVVIPAYNEEGRIGHVVQRLVKEYPVVVVDDGSRDRTTSEARAAGATVIRERENNGYISALKRGFREASSDIIVTFDADGEHRTKDIEKLVQPIKDDQFDLVLGARTTIPRPSERLINKITQLQIPVTDSGTGLRALRRDLAVDLDLDTACTCGTLVLEAAAKDARIGEVSIETRTIQKPRGIAWQHGKQLYHVFRHLLFF